MNLRRILGLLAAAALTLPAPTLAQDLVHHWDFETDGVVRDVGSRAATNGTLMGGATVVAGALHLNGSTGYVQFDTHLVPTSPSYTVSLFARAEAGANTGANRDFVSQGSAGAAFYIGVALSGRSIRAGDNWSDVAGASFIADGAFHHYALTMTANGASFYVDGVLASENAPFAGGAGGTATRLGRGPGNVGNYFSGDLDDVSIYDDALTAEQIQRVAATRPFAPVIPRIPRHSREAGIQCRPL